MLSPEVIVTFDRLDGYRIVRRLGRARAEVRRRRNGLVAGLRGVGAFLGIGSRGFLGDAERVRALCLARLGDDAERLGANGVIGVEFEVSEAFDMTTVRAIGDAVVVEAIFPET